MVWTLGMGALRLLAAATVLGTLAVGRCGPDQAGDLQGADAGEDAGVDAGTGELCPSDAGVPTIAISGFSYSPQSLTVDAGETIRVCNFDYAKHSVTSQSAPGSYTPGGVNGVTFNTGVFAGERRFTIPATAPSGTVVPYYCTLHPGMMGNDGQIVIR